LIGVVGGIDDDVRGTSRDIMFFVRRLVRQQILLA